MFGLYINDTCIYAAKGASRSGRLRVTGTAAVSLGSGIVINGFIQDGPALAAKLAEALGHFSRSDLKDAWFQVDSTTAIFRDLDVPAMGRKALDRYVYNTMKAQVANLEEYRMDYAVTPSGDPKSLRIFACALPKGLVSSYEGLLKAAGIRKFRFSVCTLSLMQWHDALPEEPEHPDQILAAQYGGLTKTILFNGRRFVIVNNVRGARPGDEPALSARLAQLLQFQKAKDPSHSVTKAYLVSDSPDNAALAAALSRTYGITVAEAAPGLKISYEGVPAFSQVAGLVGLFLPFAKSLDLCSGGRYEALTSEGEKQRSRFRLKRALIANLAIVLALGGAFWGLGYWKAREKAAVRSKLDDSAFQSDYAKARGYQDEIASLSDELSELDSVNSGLESQRIAKADYLAKIQALASGITFSDYNVTGYCFLTLTGASPDRSAIYRFVGTLTGSGLAADVSYAGFEYSANDAQYHFQVSFTAVKGGE